MLGVISEEQFLKELLNCNKQGSDVDPDDIIERAPVQPEVIIEQIKHGRGPVDEVPMELKKLIAEEAIVSGHTRLLAGKFGLSKSTVDAAKVGAQSTSSYYQKNEELQEHGNKVRTEVSSVARAKLLDALNTITKEKIDKVKVRDAATIAKNLSGVVRDMEPSGSIGINVGPQVIIYQPRMKEESDFETIEVNE